MARPRVLILGLGSLGIVLGAFLHKSGAEVVCVCRSNYQAAKDHGFMVNSPPLGSKYIYHPELAHSVPEGRALAAQQPYDYIVVATKALPGQSPSPVEIISDAVSPTRTSIVLVQNGIGVEHTYKERYPSNLIISAVAYMPSTRVSSTSVVQTETQRVLMGAYPSHPAPGGEEGDKIRRFADLLSAGGAQAEIHADIQVERWKKLVGNATWNPVCALSRCRDVELLRASDIAGGFVEAAMNEVVAVARAMGYGDQVNGEVVRAQMRRSSVRPAPGVQPSMMADMIQGGKMEVEVIVGEVVRLAREHGVAVPRLETLYVLASGLNWNISRKAESK